MGELRPTDPRDVVVEPGLESTPDSPGHSTLTQAAQHDPNGAEVGKSTEGVRCEDFCSDLRRQRVSGEELPSDGMAEPPTPRRLPGLHFTCFPGVFDRGSSFLGAAPSQALRAHH